MKLLFGVRLFRIHEMVIWCTRVLYKKKMPKSQGHGQAQTLSTEQLDAIADACSPEARVACQTCRYLACRISEALALQWGNVSSTDVVLYKSKTKGKLKTRTIPLNPRLAHEIDVWRQVWKEKYGCEPEKSDPIFPGRKGPSSTLTMVPSMASSKLPSRSRRT